MDKSGAVITRGNGDIVIETQDCNVVAVDIQYNDIVTNQVDENSGSTIVITRWWRCYNL